MINLLKSQARLVSDFDDLNATLNSDYDQFNK